MADTTLKYLEQILSVVSQFGVSEQACLSAVGMNQMPTSSRVAAVISAKIMTFAAETLNDPLIGVRCGLKYPVLQYTRPGDLLKLCANISEAAEVYNIYCPLFHRIGVPSPVISENGVDRMVWTPSFNEDSKDEYRHLMDFILTNFVTSINWLTWKIPNAVQKLNLMHEETELSAQFQKMLECEVEFEQSEYAFILKPGVKNVPFPAADAAKLTEVRILLDLALNELYQESCIINGVELQVRHGLEHRKLNRAVVASGLNMSERSMVRALSEKGTSYAEVKRRVIQSLAVAKIKQDVPLVEIAHSLGYSDQAAFTRAYKKWFGYTPGRHKSRSMD